MLKLSQVCSFAPNGVFARPDNEQARATVFKNVLHFGRGKAR